MTHVSAIATYLPCWGSARGRVAGGDEDAVTLAVEAGRAAIDAAHGGELAGGGGEAGAFEKSAAVRIGTSGLFGVGHLGLLLWVSCHYVTQSSGLEGRERQISNEIR